MGLSRDVLMYLKALILKIVLQQATSICRKIQKAEELAEDTFIDDRNYLCFDDVLRTAGRLFVQGIEVPLQSQT